MVRYKVQVKTQDENGDSHLEVEVKIEMPQFDDNEKNTSKAFDSWKDERFLRIKQAVEEQLPENTKLLVIESFGDGNQNE